MLLLAVCGGLGAVARFVVDGLIRGRVRSIGSIGTIVINVTGAIALGIIAGLVAAHVAQPDWQLVIGTGFLGGYTTFSTTSFETVRLVQQGRIGLAVGLGLAQLALALAGAAGGFALGLSL
ncbi:MAG TPA: fluoride efflux transporter CrcB [Propionibacteriaceae bacterium]|nr:fluoride efflux transporter CrcB [Propionibacteriaceae bacterium]